MRALLVAAVLLAAGPWTAAGLVPGSDPCSYDLPAPGAVLYLPMNVNDLDVAANRTANCAYDLRAMLGSTDLPDANDPFQVADPHGEVPLAGHFDFGPGTLSAAVRYLRVPHSVQYKHPTFTMSAWINAAEFTAGYGEVVGVENGFGGAGTVALVASKDPGCGDPSCPGGILLAYVCPGLNNRASSPFLMAPGTWHHVAGTFDGATLRVYIAGALVGQGPGADCFTWAPQPLYVGARGGTGDQGFRGRIDDVRIYPSALSQAAVAALAAAGPA